MSKKEEFVSIVPVAFFDCQVDKVELDANLCLRRIHGDELKELIKWAVGYEFNLENALLNDVAFVIERRVLVAPGDRQPSYSEWSEESSWVNGVLTALRLIKEKYLACPTAFYYVADKSHGVSNTSPQVKYDLRGPYLLEQKEIEVFVELWRKLQTIKRKKPHLEFPLNQFMKAYEDDFPEDMMIDYMTAFESLVFSRGGKAPRPLGRTIGIAIGMLIGKNEKEREKIKKDLEQAYSTRDKIVHGHLRFKLKTDLSLLSRAEDYLRQSLRKLVEE